MTRLTLDINVVKLGSSYIGVTKVGGITVRGKRASTEAMAAQNCLYALYTEEDGQLGIELGMDNTTLEQGLLDAGTGTSAE